MFFYPLYERELGISKLPPLLRGVGGIFFVISNECEKSTLSVHIILSMSAVILSEMEWNEGYKFTTHYILHHFVPQNDTQQDFERTWKIQHNTYLIFAFTILILKWKVFTSSKSIFSPNSLRKTSTCQVIISKNIVGFILKSNNCWNISR